MNTGKLGIGSFCLARNKKDGGGYESRWLVQFKLPEIGRKRESSKLPICAKCLENEKALQDRAKCECQKDARAWAAVRLDELVRKWKGDRLQKSEKKVKVLMLTEVEAEYSLHGPADRDDNLAALRRVVEVSKGKPFKDVSAEDLHPDDWDIFAWCYQEYERRGWTKRDGSAPADAWAQVRKALPARVVLDRKCATTGNTTILSMMRKAKSVLGALSRDSYLTALRSRFPREVVHAWWETKVKLRVPDGRFNLSREVYETMWSGLAALKQDDPQTWALIRLHWTTGLRPIESSQARVTWLEVDEGGAVLLVVKNRPEEGFTMKDAETLQARPWPLPADLVEMLPKLVGKAGNLLGCDTPGQWDRVYRRASEWLRMCGVTGTQTLYNLRKLVGTVKRVNEGSEKMAAALGHSNTRTGEEFYAGTSQVIKALTDAELAPEAVMGSRRTPWQMPQAA